MALAAPERAARTVLPLDEIRQFTDIYGAVKQYYVDPVEDKKLMKEAISGMLQGLDPHSAYLDENAFNELQEQLENEVLHPAFLYYTRAKTTKPTGNSRIKTQRLGCSAPENRGF